MKILLQSFSFGGANGYYNLGILYLKSALLSRPRLAQELEIELLQSDYFDPIEDVFEAIRTFQPDLLGFSLFIWSLDLTEALLRRCSELQHRPIIVCGGTGLVSIERDFVERNPSVDVVVRGAGEQTLVELVEHLAARPAHPRRLQGIAGLTYRDEDDNIVGTAGRAANIPLSDLPSPYLAGYHRPLASPNYLVLETDRHCPYRCAYCTWAERSRARPDLRLPVESVKNDLLWAEQNGCDVVSFFDSAINYDSQRLVSVLDTVEGAGQTGRSIEYFFFLKYDLLDRIQLERLLGVRKSCLVFLGVESFSPAALKLAGRRDRLRQLGPVLRALSSNPNLRLMVGLILGLPGDDADTFLQGLRFLDRFSSVHSMVSVLSVAPGTRFRVDAARHGLVYRRQGIPLLIESDDFPPQDLERVYGVIDSRIPTGRVSLNPIQVPVARLRNPEILPAEVRQELKPESRARVGVLGIESGRVTGRGLYPQERQRRG